MKVDSLYRPLRKRFSVQRIHLFFSLLKIDKTSTVLDVGGSLYFWELAAELGLPIPNVVILNVDVHAGGLPDNVSCLIGDGRDMPFDDDCFDAVFCNSVVEHVGEWHDQQRLAAEIRRAGRSYFVQTPDRSFPVEPHLLMPLVHWLPRSVYRRVPPGLSLRRMVCGLTAKEKEDMRNIRLLNNNEMQELFPDATINRERFCGMPKSILAVRVAQSSH